MTTLVIEAALRGLLFAAMVGAGLSLLRVKHVPARKAAWTLVLIASMAMPLLMRWPLLTGLRGKLAWAAPIRMSGAVAPPAGVLTIPAQAAPKIADQDSAALPAEPTKDPAAAPAETAILPVVDASALSGQETVAPAPERRFTWPPVGEMVVWLYLVVGGVLLLRLLFGLAAALRLWVTAEPLSPLVAPDGNVRASRRIASPVTVGSGIVLPADYAQWEQSRLQMVLAHERSHVRQMDFWLQLLAGLYTAAFWFSPLGWWLRRKLAQLGEAMSDHAGMEAAQSGSAYAQVVLEFAAMPRRRVPGVAMASTGNLSRRIDSLLNESRFRSAFAEGRRRALASLLLIPAALFAVTTLVRVPTAAAQTAPANAGPAHAPAQPGPSVASSGFGPAQASPSAAAPRTGQAFAGQGVDAGQVTDVAPQQNPPQPPPQTVPASPPAAAQPVSPQANAPTVLDAEPMQELTIPNLPDIRIPNIKVAVPGMTDSLAPLELELRGVMAGGPGDGNTFVWPDSSLFMMPDGSTHGYAYYFSSSGDSWAIVDAQGEHLSMGSGTAKQQLDLAQRMTKGPFLWFTHDGKSYIVDDPAIVAQIRALYQPMRALDQQQESLGVQQRVLGRMEEELAHSFRDSETVRVPNLSKEMTDAEAALQNLKTEQGQMLSEEKLSEVQAKLSEVEARLGTLEASAAMQNKFGAKMRELGQQQRQLGEQQRQLGQQQKKLAEQAQQQVQSIIQQCLKSGKATQVK